MFCKCAFVYIEWMNCTCLSKYVGVALVCIYACKCCLPDRISVTCKYLLMIVFTELPGLKTNFQRGVQSTPTEDYSVSNEWDL